MLDSVYLDSSVKNKLIKDVARCVRPQSQKYCADRGIPHRRSYLLYGRPGCGKTSGAKAIASEFNLRIYTISLLEPGLTDSMLVGLFQKLSAGCLLLLEDVDCIGLDRQLERFEDSESNQEAKSKADSGLIAGELELDVADDDDTEMQLLQAASFGQSGQMELVKTMIDLQKEKRIRRAKRDAEVKVARETREKAAAQALWKPNVPPKPTPPPSQVTLGCLLNAIDGVASPQGYVLMMTTNHKDSLDPALVRAGRVDMSIEFDLATAEQAEV